METNVRTLLPSGSWRTLVPANAREEFAMRLGFNPQDDQPNDVLADLPWIEAPEGTLTLERFAARALPPEQIILGAYERLTGEALEFEANLGELAAEMAAEREADDRAYLEYGWVS